MPVLEIFILALVLGLNIAFLLGAIGFFTGAIKGAPFVPTGKKGIKKILQLADIQPNDRVYDLGCGDGRIVFAAEKKGAKATGIEISLWIYLLAIINKILFRHSGEIRKGSLWDQDVSDADIIFLYLLPEMMKRFEKEVFPSLKPGCKIISHGFELPHQTVKQTIPRYKFEGRVLLYIKK